MKKARLILLLINKNNSYVFQGTGAGAEDLPRVEKSFFVSSEKLNPLNESIET